MAEYTIPSGRLPASGTWAAAGIASPGIPDLDGITTYHTITSTGDNTDRSSEINSAINNCPSGQAVRLGAGTFRCNSPIGIPWNKSGRYLIGAVDATGAPATIIDSIAGQAVQISSGNDYGWPATGAVGTVATFTKGSTSITIDDTSNFSNGQLIMIRVQNDGTVPIFPVYGDVVTPTYGNDRVHVQIARIAGIPNGTTLTLESPGLHGDYSSAASIRVFTNQGLFNNGSGIANLSVTGINSGGVTQRGIDILAAYQCWVYNCKVQRVTNFPFYSNGSYRCEFRRCWAEGTSGGTSTGGFLIEQVSSLLVIDSVIKDSPFGVEQQQFCSGNVYAYICGVSTASEIGVLRNMTFNSNHGPWSQFTLFEGNVAGAYQNDGYFGGTGYTTVFRNFLYGRTLADGIAGYTCAMNRFSRYENLVGNVMGVPGVGGGGYGMGNPNIGNSNSTSEATMLGCRSTLTTRTSATEGTITAPSGHGVTTGTTTDVYWGIVSGGFKVSRIRRGVTVGTVSGTSIPISGGLGDDLPVTGADIFVPTTNDALWEYSLDYNSATNYAHVWTGTLSTRTSATQGVITLDTGMAASFSGALARDAETARGIRWATGGSGQPAHIYVNSVTGSTVTFTTVASSVVLPAQGSTIYIWPSHSGFQEHDLDVLYTSLLKSNYLGLASGSGIPAVEAITPDTLANSLFLSAEPQFFTDSGKTWPPVDPTSPTTNTYELIPAGTAYNTGWWVDEVTTVSSPAFSTGAGTYNNNLSITITCATTGATIRYTTDGSTPSNSVGTVYTGAVSITGTTTLKAIAYDGVLIDSNVTSATYTLTVATPTLSPAPGIYTSDQNITVSCSTTGATIYYTVDNSVPDNTDIVYTGPINITSITTETLRTIAYKTNYTTSAATVGVYQVEPPPAGTGDMVVSGTITVGTLRLAG